MPKKYQVIVFHALQTVYSQLLRIKSNPFTNISVVSKATRSLGSGSFTTLPVHPWMIRPLAYLPPGLSPTGSMIPDVMCPYVCR